MNQPPLGDTGDDLFGAEDENQPATPVALVSTLEPLTLRVQVVDDDRIPTDMVCMGSFIDGRLIARSAVPPAMLDDILGRSVFHEPVRIALAAVVQDPGLQCRLFALLPAEQFREEPESEEPWAQSVPRFEDTLEQEETEDGVVPLLLGHIVRFERDRKHPGDLAAEAADVLQTILADQTPLSNVVDKILDDLLDDS